MSAVSAVSAVSAIHISDFLDEIVELTSSNADAEIQKSDQGVQRRVAYFSLA